MSAIHWSSQTSGAFSNHLDWTGGVVPGSSDDAILDAGGSTAYTVSSTSNRTVHSIQTLATATLDITTASLFLAGLGTGSGSNKGTIKAEGGSTFEVGGNLANIGSISLGSATTTGELLIDNSVSLTGGGHIVLSNKLLNYIGGSAGSTLINVDNTISGSGYVGDFGILPGSDLTLINRTQGVIDATGVTPLILQTPNHTVVNQGLIEATGAGSLSIQATVDDTLVSGFGVGTISAAGANVYLTGAHVIGGYLNSSGAGAIHSEGGPPGVLGANLLDGTHAYGLTNNGLVVVDDNSALSVIGSITNLGTLRVDGSSNAAELLVGAGGASFTGSAAAHANGGANIVLTSASKSVITGASATSTLTLSTWQFITGQGQVGGGQLTLVLKPLTFIDANAAGALVLSTGAGSIINNGIIRASSTGGLKVVDSLVTGSGSFDAANSVITLQGAHIVGQGLEADGTGVIISDGALLDGRAASIVHFGAMKVAANSTLTLEGNLNNDSASTLTLGAASTFGTLLVLGSASLSGGGKVILSDNGDNTISGVNAGTTFTNNDNTISGAGLIGGVRMAFVNKAAGLINANGVNALTIDTAGMTMTNAGWIQASGSGGLALQNVKVNGSTGGTISIGAGSVVTLRNTTLVGGTLMSSGTGVFQTLDNFNLLDGRSSTVTDSAEIDVGGSTKLTIEGAIANSGLISLNGVGGYSILAIGGAGTTLSGGGHLTLSDVAGNIVVGATVLAKLTNVDNTISGSGQLGQGQMVLANQAGGVINANGADDGGLTINTGSHAITNAGLIESTGDGGMTIKSAVTNSGTLKVGDGAEMSLKGSIANTGVITLAGAGSGAALEIGSSTTLTGGGVLTLSDDSNNQLSFDGCSNFDNTISGAGSIGGVLTEKAGAVINATGANNALELTGAITNKGLIKATGAAGLDVSGTVDDTSGGTLEALAGSSVRLVGSVSGGTLTAVGGGQLIAKGGTLDGTASAITISATIGIADENGLNLLGTIKNQGSIALNATVSYAILSVGTAASLTGGGTIVLGDNVSNEVNNTGGFTNVNNTISGAGYVYSDGAVNNQAAGTINANGAVNALTLRIDTFNNAGLIEATGAGGGVIQGYALGGALNNSGVLEANGGVLRVRSVVTGTGTGVIAAGTLQFENSFNENVSFTGTSGTLTLFQSLSYGGSVSGFSHAGGEFIDLRDVGFVSAAEASFSGTSSGGVLTVTDGTNTAQIHLTGNYLSSTFVAADDGAGGVIIHDPAASPHAVQKMAQAMAAFAPAEGAVYTPASHGDSRTPALLARPHV